MKSPADDHIRSALSAVSAAIADLEAAQADAYAEAAFDCRITAYGNLCARRVLLQQARSILSLLARSIPAPHLLAADGHQGVFLGCD